MYGNRKLGMKFIPSFPFKEGSALEQRLPGKKLAQALKEMKEISHMEYALFHKKGKLLASTTPEIDEKIQELVVLFGKSMADSQTVQNWIFLKIEINDQTEHILLASNNGAGDASYVIGQMACCQIRNLYLAAQEPTSEINFLRQVLNGELSEQQIEEKKHQVRMKNGSYLLYVIQFAAEQSELTQEMLKNMFVVYGTDYLLDVDDRKMVLIKNTKGMDVGAYLFGQRIIDNLQMEMMCNAWVGYSDVTDEFALFHEKYQQACMALKVGMVFNDDARVFYYRKLGLGRLIAQLSVEMCDLFLEEILGEHAEQELDEEAMATIRHLFDNNLNISETARQLYIHRNTLVYRLERIEKKIGLDIRTFEDAMLFKIAMMVRTHRNSILGGCQNKNEVIE